MTTALRDLIAQALHEAEDGPTCPRAAKHQETYEPLADAVLALCEVAEEWGVTWPGAPQEVDWRGSREKADAVIEARRERDPAWANASHLVRRFVLTTKPEEVNL